MLIASVLIAQLARCRYVWLFPARVVSLVSARPARVVRRAAPVLMARSRVRIRGLRSPPTWICSPPSGAAPVTAAPIVIYTIPSFSCWSELLPPAHSCSYDAGLGAVRSLTLGGFALGHMVIVDLRPACPLPALLPSQLFPSSSTRSRASRAGPNLFRLRTRAAMALGSVLCAA